MDAFESRFFSLRTNFSTRDSALDDARGARRVDVGADGESIQRVFSVQLSSLFRAVSVLWNSERDGVHVVDIGRRGWFRPRRH